MNNTIFIYTFVFASGYERSTTKTTIVAFESYQVKITINGTTTERVSHFQYLRYGFTYDNGKNEDNKTAKFYSVLPYKNDLP